MHSELDLETAIRPGLDILANEIVIALKKRSRFARNLAVYTPGLVKAEPATTLLDYELGKVERAHAELGRYTYASQEPFTDVDAVAPVLAREAPAHAIVPMRTHAGPRVVEFHLDWVRRACREGTDLDTFGETVTADVAALLCIMERINLGKYVAESKFAADAERFRATGGDREALLALIVKKDREAAVLDLARGLAEHYELAAEHVERVFDWMIGATIDIEIDYLRMRLGLDR